MPNISFPSQKYGIENLDFLGDKFKIDYSTITGNFQIKLGGDVTILMGILSMSMSLVVMSQLFKGCSSGHDLHRVRLEGRLLQPLLAQPLPPARLDVPRAENITRFVTIMAIVTQSPSTQSENPGSRSLHIGSSSTSPAPRSKTRRSKALFRR